MQPETHSFSLILATCGRTAELTRFFASLESSGSADCECIVVDQNQDDRLVPIIEQWSTRLSILHLRSSKGLSRARNVGLLYAKGDVLAFPDDDCWYSPGLLRRVNKFFAANPAYAMLSVGVRDETGTLSGNRWVRSSCDLATPNLFRTSVGMALFVRRSRTAGSLRFDESLGVGAGTPYASGEDTDYVFRLLAAGLRGRFERSLTVYHPRHDMLSGQSNPVRAYLYGCGMGRVIRQRAKLPLLPAFVAFDFLRTVYSLLRGKTRSRLFVRCPRQGSLRRILGAEMSGPLKQAAPRVAITYHYSLSFGGSERVIEALAEMYPEADFFTLFVDGRFLPDKLKGRKITTSFLDRIPGGRRIYRPLLPLYPLAVECLDLSGYDLVISADGAATKGVLSDQGALHLCYCHSPPRSFWDQYGAQRRRMGWSARAAFAPISQYMRHWDYAAAQRIDGFVANSSYVADRIWKYYRRESDVIYPPVDTVEAYLSKTHEDFYLSVGRLVAPKRVDLLIETCNRMGRRLRIVGTGPEERKLRLLAGATIEFLGHIDDAQLRQNYACCRALLFAADEDFGLVSIEAQSFGRPVIAYGRGGSLETVMAFDDPERKRLESPGHAAKAPTGIFFPEQTQASLSAAVRRFEEVEACFDPVAIQHHARQFDTQVFAAKLQRYVDDQFAIRRRAGEARSPTQNRGVMDASSG